MAREWCGNILKLLLSSAFLCSWLAGKPALTVPATPLAFEPNVGQADRHAKFLAHTPNGMLWLTEQGAVLGLAGAKVNSSVEMQFEGASAMARIEGEDQRPGISNYFTGKDRRNWHTDVPQFGKVRYIGVYPGVDVVFYGNPSNLEYDFVLSPGADPSRIRLAFPGTSKLLAESDGSLAIQGGQVQFRNLPPLISQDGKRVAGHWKILGENRAGFEIDRFDRSKPMVIDPVMTYATYLGGATPDGPSLTPLASIAGVAVDAQGNIIASGGTNELNFPVAGALYASIPKENGDYGFVTKINPFVSGAASVVFSTYFNIGMQVRGGAVNAVASDRNGNVYLTGNTGDSLPLQNPLPNLSALPSTGCPATINGQPTPNGPCTHGFITEISPTGNKLLFSSYLGGTVHDEGYALTVDSAGNIYIAGETNSFDFPLAGNFVQSGPGGARSGFVSVISPSYSLTFSTYFSSSGSADQVNAIAVDSSGRIFIAGTAGAPGLPSAGGFQPNYPGGANQPQAGFAAILKPSAQPVLLYSTYLGGSDFDSEANAVATDGKGNIFVAGSAQATDFPVTASAVRGPGGGINPKAFVTKLNPSAQGTAQLAYSTILGGADVDIATGIAVDPAGRILVAGYTSSPGFQITANALQPDFVGVIGSGQFPSNLGFLAQIDPTLSGANSLLYSSFVGGTSGSGLNALTLDATGKIAIVGGGSTSGAPVMSAYQANALGSSDAYLARFDMSQTGPIVNSVQNAASLSADPNGSISPGMIVTLKGTGLGPAAATNGFIDPTSGKVSTSAAGVQVLIDSVPCPLLYLSATQINAIAPYELATKRNQFVQVQVVYNQVPGNVLYKIVNLTNPGIFSFDDGSGQGAILNQDGTVNGPSNAAARGTFIQIFATGEGQTVPPGVDGAIANEPLGSIPSPAAAVSLTIGGVAVPASAVTYAGTLPGGVAGALQINAMIPANAPVGSAIPIVLTIGNNSSSKKLTLAIQ
jgi:uncharacterized protein (TIGR03437 family)